MPQPSRAVAHDSPSASTRASTAAMVPISKFKYEWVTNVDEDGKKWYLVCATTKNPPYDAKSYKGNRKNQVSAFEKVLCAIHSQKYLIKSAEELATMTELADYYCALSIVSRTLGGALFMSPKFVKTIRNDCAELLVTATKLRNAMLFREALVWVVGPNNHPSYQALPDRRLKMIAKAIHSEILIKVSKLCQVITFELGDESESDHNKKRRSQYLKNLENVSNQNDELNYPEYFRRISDKSNFLTDYYEFQYLLKSNLLLDRDSTAGSFECGYRDHFLCAEITDEDLPWDMNETDW